MLSALEMTAAEQAGLTADGPGGLGRPTHVLVNTDGGIHAAWRYGPAWLVRRLGWWHGRELHPLFEPWRSDADVLLAIDDGWVTVIDLAELAERIGQEADRPAPSPTATVAGAELTCQQRDALTDLLPLLAGAAHLPGRTVIVTPRHWPQLLTHGGFPVRRMAVTQPSVLIVPAHVDAPDEDV